MRHVTGPCENGTASRNSDEPAGQVPIRQTRSAAFSQMPRRNDLRDDRQSRRPDRRSNDLARRICTRALIGRRDGLIPHRDLGARRRSGMRYFNSDGAFRSVSAELAPACAARSPSSMSSPGRKMTIETDAGIVSAEILDGGQVILALPPPSSFRPQRPLTVGNQTLHGSSILVGVPHYVLFLRDDTSASLSTGLWSQNIAPLGSAIRQHPDLRADGGANVNFVTGGTTFVEVRTSAGSPRGGRRSTAAPARGLVPDERSISQSAVALSV